MDDAEALAKLLTLSPWNVEVGREVVDALASMGRLAVPALARALRRGPQTARAVAARVLGRIGGDDARAALCLATHDADPHIALVAREALAHVGAPPCPAAA